METATSTADVTATREDELACTCGTPMWMHTRDEASEHLKDLIVQQLREKGVRGVIACGPSGIAFRADDERDPVVVGKEARA